METAAKRAREVDPPDDRLSALPDDLLQHVLSFLPSRRAVQTSVLSRRWTGLWRSVRRIDIRIDVASRNYVYNSYSKEKWEKAEAFINNLLKFHHAPTLDALRIYISSNHKDLIRDCCYSSKMLVIRAPALVSLRIVTVLYDNGVMLDGPMDYLVNASIFPFDNGNSNLSRVSLLGSLFNVTNLELIGLSAQVMLDKELDKYPIFMNLKTLSINACLYRKTLGEDGCIHSSCDPNEKLKALGRLLHKAPNLERLTLESCWRLQESKQKMAASDLSLRSPDQKAFDCPNLKLIEIKYADDGTDDEHQMFQLVCGLLRNRQNPLVTFSRI